MQTFANRFGKLIALHPFAPNCTPENLTAADITEAGLTDDRGIFKPFAEPLYATETDNLNLLLQDAMNDCDQDSIWQILAAARKSALTFFEEGLTAGIQNTNKARFERFQGNIGQYDTAGFVSVVNGQRITTTITPRDLPGASITISEIGLLLDSDADVMVSVPGLDAPVLVVCAANTPSFATLSTPVTLPLEGQPLSFGYTVANFRPRNNKLNCDCSGRQALLKQFFPDLVDKPANGLMIKADIACNPLNIIFSNFDDNDTIKLVMKLALQFKTLEKAIERIQNSGVVSRYTMMEAEYLWGKRNNYRKEYQDRVNYLTSTEGFVVAGSGCFVCKQTSGIRRGAILA
jgi:hypothetical protein